MKKTFSILTFVVICIFTALGQTQHLKDKIEQTDTIKIIGQLITEGVGSKIYIAQFKVLKVLQGKMPHDSIQVGYYFYTIDSILPTKSELTLLKYQGDSKMDNYFIFPNYNAKLGLTYIPN